MSSSDRELTRLVKRAIRGDQKAFEALYLRYLKEIIFQARKLLDLKEDAEDAAQEIVLALHRNIKSLSSPFAFHSYLYRTIYTTCTNRNMRRGGKDLQLEDFEETLAESEETQPEQRFEEREIRAEIRALVDRLAPKQRLCVYLYYFYDMSYEEIAKVLDATTNAVGVNLTKARRAMERLLTEDRQNEQDRQNGQSTNDVSRNGLALAPLVSDALREGINLEVSEQTVAGVAAACNMLLAGGATVVSTGLATAAAAAPMKSLVSTVLVVTLLLGGATATGVAVMHAVDERQALTATEQTVVEKPGFVPQAQIVFESVPVPVDDAAADDGANGEAADAASDEAEKATNAEDDQANTVYRTVAYLNTDEGWGEVWYLYDENGKELVTGTSERIEGPLDDLAPGHYTVKWVLINTDGNRAVATQPFTVS